MAYRGFSTSTYPKQNPQDKNKKAARRRSPRRPVAILPRNALAVVARVDVRLIWVRLLTKTVILAPPPVVGAAVADSPLRVGRRRRRLLGLARSERPLLLDTDAAQDAACARTRRREAAPMASGGISLVGGVAVGSAPWAPAQSQRDREQIKRSENKQRKGNAGHGKTQSFDWHGEV